ncbi:MAG: SulP family inorganic anion transporter [Actinomycetota bacterium]|nr:SulP family inorganic anion transporter [Actinomycetota bacterium]
MSQQTSSRPGWFESHLPIVAWGRRYKVSWLSRDVVAGLTLWGLVVPEGMAYAGIAGMPPEAGLYTAMAALVAYAIFGSSRQLVVVGTSATAALLAGTVAALNPEDADTYAAYAAALVLLVGLLFVLAGLAKLGFIAQFLPRPVMEGFVLGLAIFVAVGQLNKLFGVEKGEGNVPQKLWHVITELGDANWWSFAVGMVALIALFALPHLSKALPSGLVVLAGGILLSAALDLSGNHGVEVVGTLPEGLPSPRLPDLDAGDLWTLVPAAIGIMLVAYSEALGVAGSMASKHGYDIDPNQELIAHGVANLASGSIGGLVAGGGMSSSAVNDGAKARTQVSGLTAAVVIVLTILFLTPIFKDLPEACARSADHPRGQPSDERGEPQEGPASRSRRVLDGHPRARRRAADRRPRGPGDRDVGIPAAGHLSVQSSHCDGSGQDARLRGAVRRHGAQSRCGPARRCPHRPDRRSCLLRKRALKPRCGEGPGALDGSRHQDSGL